ncbi:MAG: GPR endopeptidase [Clostridia bacterium]|nr:GPR endopeptidase [Clostridia bacterium]
MYNFRTDLATERRDIFKKSNNLQEIDGIESEIQEVDKNLKIERVFVTNENGEKAVGKPKGTYITIDIKNLKIARDEEIQKASDVLTGELSKILDKHITRKDEMLVVGLGNVYVTPDSLGPKVINEIDITRHLLKYMPQYLDENTRNVCAIAPGVLGTTGMETLEILKGVVDNVKPKVVVVIDSLASRSIERISSSLQISDTGIVPGAGVGNARAELSQDTLGIPVIALGIPTVVELATLVSDGIDIFIDRLQEKAESNDYLNKLQKEDKYEEVKDALNVGEYNMIVTPKEIDDLIENMKDIVARGINQTIS